MASRVQAPTKEEMSLLQPFPGLTLDRISVVSSKQEADAAYSELSNIEIVGFDTESKPLFTKGEVSDGPHVVQFATSNKAFIFQLHRSECHEVVTSLLESSYITKVGFGLVSDRQRLSNKFGVSPKAVFDLDTVFRRNGYRKSIGVRAAVAIVFNQRFQKSKGVTTSDWSRDRLKTNQILYAANDAYAAIQVFEALGITKAQRPTKHSHSFPVEPRTLTMLNPGQSKRLEE